MPLPADRARPVVFVSFAGNDRATALKLGEDLRGRGVDTWVDDRSIAPGEDLVLAISSALEESDYYVLLWSRHTVDRPWVDAEWTAAFSRDLEERRSFLFIVRLDDTPLPLLLAARKYLDAPGNWDGVVDALATTWRADLAQGTPVLPAPHQSVVDGAVVLYVRNRALSVTHVISVPATTTGKQLHTSVRASLALPDQETKFGGTVGMRFFYQLKVGDEPIGDGEVALTDGSTVDLEVQFESFGPDGTFSRTVFRGDSDGHSPALTRSLITRAFGHLKPRAKPHRRTGSARAR